MLWPVAALTCSLPQGASRLGPLGQRYSTLALLATLCGARLRRRRRRRYFSRVAADKSDEQGVLGNLPRARPGVRSSKRRGSSGTATGTEASGKASGKSAPAKARASAAAGTKPNAESAPSKRAAAAPRPKPAKRAAAASRPKPAPPPRPERNAPQPPTDQQRGSTDPLTGAVRLAGKVAEAGLKTAGGLLKRLPGR